MGLRVQSGSNGERAPQEMVTNPDSRGSRARCGLNGERAPREMVTKPNSRGSRARCGSSGEHAPRRRAWTESLHVWVLVSFAVAQPLYDLLGTQAEFFVFQNAGRVEILVLVVALSGLLPLALVGVERLAGLVGLRTERGVHYAVVAVGVALTVLPALRPVEAVPGIALMYAALVLGAGVAVLYARFGAVRLFFTLLAPAVVVFPVMFLAASPVTPLLVQEERARALAPATIGSPAPIVFVVLDEFPTTSLMDAEERIDAERYPNFAALARDATWYRRATTVGETTYDAVPAILTGKYPRPGRLPHAIDHPENLFTLLAGTYEMHAAGALTQLCPLDLCARDDDRGASGRVRGMLSDLAIVYLHLVLSDDLRALLPPIAHKWKAFGENTRGPEARIDQIGHVMDKLWRHRDDRWQEGLDFIQAIRAGDRPSLYFLHLMLPHDPYVYLPSGTQYSTEDGLPGLSGRHLGERRYANDRWNVLQLYQRHLLQVGAVDTWLGRLLNHLRSRGLYDESLIVLTADHGVSFRPGEHDRSATEATFQDILPVPLFIKAPFQEKGRIDDRSTQVVDILSSVTDLIEADLPWPVDGWSVFEQASTERATRVHRFPDAEPAIFTGLAEAMHRAAGRRHDLFGSGPWYPGLFVRGTHGAWIGAKLDELAMKETVVAEVTVDRAGRFTHVDPATGLVPAHITGQLATAQKGHPVIGLAVAINGTIEAVTEPWKVPVRGRAGSWSAIVPEAAFRTGENAVDVLVLTGVGGEIGVARAKVIR